MEVCLCTINQPKVLIDIISDVYRCFPDEGLPEATIVVNAVANNKTWRLSHPLSTPSLPLLNDLALNRSKTLGHWQGESMDLTIGCYYDGSLPS